VVVLGQPMPIEESFSAGKKLARPAGAGTEIEPGRGAPLRPGARELAEDIGDRAHRRAEWQIH
jgi:hypothetical protein